MEMEVKIIRRQPKLVSNSSFWGDITVLNTDIHYQLKSTEARGWMGLKEVNYCQKLSILVSNQSFSVSLCPAVTLPMQV